MLKKEVLQELNSSELMIVSGGHYYHRGENSESSDTFMDDMNDLWDMYNAASPKRVMGHARKAAREEGKKLLKKAGRRLRRRRRRR